MKNKEKTVTYQKSHFIVLAVLWFLCGIGTGTGITLIILGV